MLPCPKQAVMRPAQVDVAALRLRDSILTSAETEGLTYQGYWLSTTLALGAFLKVSDPSHAEHACLQQCLQQEHSLRVTPSFPFFSL